MTAVQGLVLKTAPTVEPVSLADMRTHLRVDSADEESLISATIMAARRYAEIQTWRAFVQQTWELSLDEFPNGDGTIELPKPPLLQVNSVKYLDTLGVLTTLNAANYRVDIASEPGRLTPAYGLTWPDVRSLTAAVVINYNAGYGTTAADVPMPLRQAIKILAAHWFEVREPVVEGHIVSDVPLSIDDLLSSYRMYEVQ